MSTGHHNEHPMHAHAKPPFEGKEQEAPGSEEEMNPKPDYGEDSYVGHDRLKGDVAVVTGGDSGIGRAVCLAFAREGADIVVSYLNEHQDAEKTKAAVEKSGRKCLLVPGDISEDAQCKKVIDETIKAFGKINVLVNNAAYQGKAVKEFTELNGDRVLHTFKTNIVAMFNLSRYAIPHIKEGGSIINTSSIQAYSPSANILDYACTKGAIVTFTKGLGQELIEKGIRVNCVAPGPVWTPLIVQSFPKEKIETFGQENSPLKRPAQPVELAPCYVFLASADARYVNGEILGCTGGKPLG